MSGGVARAEDHDQRKDPDTAVWWSAGGTIATAGVFAVGAVVYLTTDSNADHPVRILKVPLHNWGNGLMAFGAFASTFAPSFGEYYAHEFWTRGMTLRLVGGVVAGIGAATQNFCVDPADFDCPNRNNNGGSDTLIVVGALAYAGGIAYDIVHARDAARSYNRSHGGRATTVFPTAVRGTTSMGYGLVAGGTF